MRGWGLSDKNQIQVFVENLYTSKPAEFYSNYIEEMPDTYQQVIANNSEYMTE